MPRLTLTGKIGLNIIKIGLIDYGAMFDFLTFRKFKHHYRLEIEVAKKTLWLTVASFLLGLALVIAASVWFNSTRTYHYPLSEKEPTPTPTPTPEPVVEAKIEARKTGEILEGEATIYTDTIEGCLGCQPHYDENGGLYFVMANGEKLDCERKTVACGVGTSCELFPLGTTVVVQNVENGMFTRAVVTDTGGFGKLYGRVLDMTPAVARSIGVEGKGQVRVWSL